MQLTRVVETSTAVSATRSRKRKAESLAALLVELDGGLRPIVVPWLAGELRQGRIGVGPAALREVWETPASSAPQLRVAEVDALFTAISQVSGKGSKARRRELLVSLLERATPDEQSFLMRLLFGELRQGALEGVLIEALSAAAGVAARAVRRALMLSGDAPRVAEAAFEGGDDALAAFHLELFTPLQPMLADTAEAVGEVTARFGEAAWELKLDGARVQVHKEGERVRVWSRQLREVTASVPEVVEAARALPVERAVLDGEAIALRPDGTPLPFQVTMKRFGRSRDVAASRRQLPLSVLFFDALLLDQELIDARQRARVGALEQLAPPEHLVPRIWTADPDEAGRFLTRAIRDGHEGLMAKDPDSTYEAGHRGSSWLKLKPSYTLDLVVLAAEWGSGRRKGWLSNLHLGARDGEGFVMLGKTFKGLTDELLRWQTEQLLARETRREEHVVFVRPELVVEIAFNEVQQSPRYPGGLALRFARVKRYRADKTATQADTLELVRKIHRREVLPG